MNHWLETCYMLLHAHFIVHCVKHSLLRVWVVCIGDWLFSLMLSYFLLEKSWKKQLSVMGMSLRIGMWSPVSLTLKPRVGITLIAASRDSLNPQLSRWGFFLLWQLSGRLYALLRLWNTPHQLGHKNGYAVLILQKSILITFLCTYLPQSCIFSKFLTWCPMSWMCQTGIWES